MGKKSTFLIWFLFLSCFSWAIAEVQIQVVDVCSSGNGIYADPDIYSDKVVWCQYLNVYDQNIHYKDIFTGLSGDVSIEPGVQRYPAVYGDVVVWADGSSGDYDLFAKVGSNAKISILEDENASQKNISIFENKIVWVDFSTSIAKIYYCEIIDGIASSPMLLSASQYLQTNPDIHGDYAVWQEQRGGFYDIVLFNLKTQECRYLTLAEADQSNPKIYGNVVVWQDSRSGNIDIYAYSIDDEREFAVCTNEYDQKMPDVFGDYIVWEDERDGLTQIYCYDLKAYRVFKLNGSQVAQTKPAVSDKACVWVEGNNIKAGIWPERTLEVINPTEGVEFLAGKQVEIQWTTSMPQSGEVSISYSVDYGCSWVIIDDSVLNTGSYIWQMPSGIEADICLVRVIANDGDFFSADSSGEFSIVLCDAGLTADLNGDCEVNVDDFAIFITQWLQKGY